MANELLSQVKKVNDLLHAGEPGNVSLDEHTGYTGYKPQFVIDAMNEVFGIGAWGFDELSNEISNASSDKGLAIAQVKVWLAGSESRPTGWGQNRVTRGDIGDAHKGAQTDAIKKALSYFSVGTRAYQGLLVAGEKGKQNGHQQPQRPPQPKPQQPQAPMPPTTLVTADEIDAVKVSALKAGAIAKGTPNEMKLAWQGLVATACGAYVPPEKMTVADLAKVQATIAAQQKAS